MVKIIFELADGTGMCFKICEYAPLWIVAFYYVYQIETAAKFEMEIEGRGQIYSGSCQCQ